MATIVNGKFLNFFKINQFTEKTKYQRCKDQNPSFTEVGDLKYTLENL